jgi:hypothetical protein
MQGGKEYFTVAERLTLAHGEDNKPHGIKSIDTIIVTDSEYPYIKAIVTFNDERMFSGTASIRSGGRGAEATNPLEVAETSAVGRALAFGGWSGSELSIASADEVFIAKARDILTTDGRAPTEAPNGIARTSMPRRVR